MMLRFLPSPNLPAWSVAVANVARNEGFTPNSGKWSITRTKGTRPDL